MEAWTPEGDLLVSDPDNGKIMELRPDAAGTAAVTTLLAGLTYPQGMAFARLDGKWVLYVAESDQIDRYPWGTGTYSDAFGQVIRGYVNNHPPDEVVPVTAGRDLGWPYCDPDQDDSNPAASLADVPLVPDEATNPRGNELDCAALAPLQVGLPAHSAPLGITFLEGSKVPAPWSGGAVVAAHGSWDRQPPQAPAVLWLAWSASKDTLEPAITLVGGFENSDHSYWGRPVDAVPGPDGAWYVSDDTAGAIYRLAPAA